MDGWPEEIHLDTPERCEAELERCTNGMAYLDHLFTRSLGSRDDADVKWEDWEAKAAAEVGEKGITATELRGRITRWVSEHPEAGADRAAHRKAHTRLEKVARWYRSLEQRSTNAQAALKRHLGGARYGGQT